MIALIVTIIYTFVAYLALTAGSGSFLGFWSVEEIIMGVFLSIIVGAISRKYLCKSGDYRMLNPLRWLLFVVYGFGPFFFAMAKANIDVAYRVVTGKIRPGIVKIKPELKTDFGVTFLANSITLTPGTLSVDVDDENNLYVHWINIPEGEEKNEISKIEKVCGSFAKWARRVAE